MRILNVAPDIGHSRYIRLALDNLWRKVAHLQRKANARGMQLVILGEPELVFDRETMMVKFVVKLDERPIQ